MKILHLAAHLGGGVGKAHAALCLSDGPDVSRHYILLEAPRDRRFADEMLAAGAAITVMPDEDTLLRAVAEADIVQVEWWNHPRLYELLCRTPLPALRSVVWCHISGLFPPFVPSGLFTLVDRVVFTSPCSLAQESVQALSPADRQRLAVIGSGFGFDTQPARAAARRHPGRVTSLGTLDFAKMSPAFFDVVDAVETDLRVSLWGGVDPEGPVAAAARAMRRPERIAFRGHTPEPARVLAEAGIFLYLLHPEHYGTGENGLVEAMSLGLVPLAFDNPAERCIIEHGVSGWLEKTPQDAARRLDAMLADPETLATMGANAMAAAARRTPAASAAAFEALYREMLGCAKRPLDFADRLGASGAHWFLGTQRRVLPPDGALRALLAQFPAGGAEAKGSLAHFRAALAHDRSLDL